jgi:hypothetical protein
VVLPFSRFHMNSPGWLSRTRRSFYDLLFHTSAASWLEVAADAKHLGAQIGILLREDASHRVQGEWQLVCGALNLKRIAARNTA